MKYVDCPAFGIKPPTSVGYWLQPSTLLKAVDPGGDVALAPAQAAKSYLTWLRHAFEFDSAIVGGVAPEAGEVHDLPHGEQVVRFPDLHGEPFCTWLGKKVRAGPQPAQSAYFYAQQCVSVTATGYCEKGSS